MASRHSLTYVLINAEVRLDKDDYTALAWVVKWAVDSNGKLIGARNSNPILNTLVYENEFSDGTIKEYVANEIVFNIYAEGNAYGFASLLLIELWNTSCQGMQLRWLTRITSLKLAHDG